MTIDKAIVTLKAYLGEPEVFEVTHDGENLNFVYRTTDVGRVSD